MNAFFSFRRVGLLLGLIAILLLGGVTFADDGAKPMGRGKTTLTVPAGQGTETSVSFVLRNMTGADIDDIEVCSFSSTDTREIRYIDVRDVHQQRKLDDKDVRPVPYENGTREAPKAPLEDDNANEDGVSWNPDLGYLNTECVEADFSDVSCNDNPFTVDDERDFVLFLRMEEFSPTREVTITVQPTVAGSLISRTITNGDVNSALASATAGQAIGDIVIQELGAGALAPGLVMIAPVTPGFAFSGQPTALVEMGDIAVGSPIVVGGEIQLPIKSYGKFPGLIKLSHLQVDTDATFPETTQASVLAGVRSQPAGVTEESFVIADTRGSGKPANVRFWLPLVMRNYTPPSRGYVYLAEGSLAVLRTAQTTESEPLYGYLTLAWSWGLSNSGSFHTGGGGGTGKVNIQDLSFTLPASAPLGLLQVELAEPAELVVGPDLSAKGPMSLRVWLPLHDVTLTAVGMAQLQNVSGLYQRLLLDFTLEPGSPLLEPTYQVGFSAGLELDVVTEDEIRKLIEELDDDDFDVRESAQKELIRIGRPALPQLKKALAGPPPPTAEQEWRLRAIIQQIEAVTMTGAEWIGNGIGVYIFTFTVTVPDNGEDWTQNVCDLHFIVGNREQSAIDHSSSTITHDLPAGWGGSYDSGSGEYKFDGAGVSGKCDNPLIPGKKYTITIRTASMKKGQSPGDMGWYWTTWDPDEKERAKVGDAGTTKGPVFLK